MNLKNKKGITLIALVVTIIILLILASVSINLISGNNGLLGRAKFTDFISEYSAVNEAKEMYVYEKEIDKASVAKTIEQMYQVADANGTPIRSVTKTTEKVYQVADVNGTPISEDTIYPVSTKVNIESVPESLKYCIIKLENISEEELTNTELVNLRLVDFSKIAVKAKRNYVINIKSGMLYALEGEIYEERTYHTPSLGVNSNAEMIYAGDYELIIDAGEGKVVNWEIVNIYYDKYVANSLTCKVYTSDDKKEWKEHVVESQGVVQKQEVIEIIEPDITRYLKVEVEIESINGKNSEVAYILVNYFGYRASGIIPTINATGATKVGSIYTVPTPSNGQVAAQGTGTVTQTIAVPIDGENYVLNLEEIIGSPSTIVKITNSDGTTEEYTINKKSDLKDIKLTPGATVEITTTLSAGDGVGEVELLVADKTVSSQNASIAISYDEDDKSEEIDAWKTKSERTYLYNNGGSGFWEKSLLNGTNIDRTGIIEQGENKRVKVTYQTSADGNTWSEEFTNIQDAENIMHLKVRVQYQVLGNIEYGDTSSNILVVILNDGSYKARFYDEDGTLMFTDRVYFTSRDESATYTMPDTTVQKEGMIFAGWIYGNAVLKPGETCTITSDGEFTAKYRVILSNLTQGKANFEINPSTGWQEKVTVTINSTLEDEETTILQYKIGDDGTWKTYEAGFEVKKNTPIYGRYYNTLTEEIGYAFSDEVENIDDVKPTVTITSSSKTSKTITVTVGVTDNEAGMPTTPSYTYYIGESEGNYTLKTPVTQNSNTYTYSGLTAGQRYYIKVESADKCGNVGEVKTDIETDNPILVTSITLNKTNEYLQTKKTLQLSATVKPDNADNKSVTWSISSNSGVATINASTGLVTAGSNTGTVTVTCTANDDSKKTATCKIEVTNISLIRTRKDLESISANLSGSYMLINDIDLDPNKDNDGDGKADGNWTPIPGNFTGTLNGNGHTIKNMTVTTDKGLFKTLYTGATVMKLRIVDAKMNSTTNGGVLCMNLYGATISEVAIEDSYVNGNISNIGTFGMTARSVYDSLSFTNCYAKGITLNKGCYCAGFTGNDYSSGAYKNCYFWGNFTNPKYTPGAIYLNAWTPISNCYYNSTVRG